MKKLIVAVVSCLVVACASSTKPDSSHIQPASNTVQPVAATVAPASTAETAASQLVSELQELQKENVYFDFDKYAVKPAFQDAIRKQADFIKSHTNDVVTLEGNCDERGSEKYNLALGDRRAKAVRKQLLALGVPATQIKTLSYGKSKPRLLCHEEKCWKENRRVDFQHSVK